MRAARPGSSKEGRAGLIQSVRELSAFVGVSAICHALGIPRATYYRAIAKPVAKPDTAQAGCDPAESIVKPQTTPVAVPAPESDTSEVSDQPAERETGLDTPPPAPTPVSAHSRTLTLAEQQRILDTLHSERFVDRSPLEVYYTLLDEGIYLGSPRTYYRILAKNQEVKERRAQRRHPDYHKPELLATGPNQVWTWDITKLLGPTKWTYYYLYVIIDIYSRYVVGWMLAEREAAGFAQQLIEETYIKQNIQPGQLTIHSDRGSPMQATPMVGLHARLDITKSNSRPHVSNDNPFSESHFKTMKYSPGFPRRFEGGFEEASEFSTGFFPYYNEHHRHSGIAYLTPHMVHYGQADQALAERHIRLQEAYLAHPERFLQGPPKPRFLDRTVYINPPKEGSAPATSLAQA